MTILYVCIIYLDSIYFLPTSYPPICSMSPSHCHPVSATFIHISMGPFYGAWKTIRGHIQKENGLSFPTAINCSSFRGGASLPLPYPCCELMCSGHFTVLFPILWLFCSFWPCSSSMFSEPWGKNRGG